MNDHITDVILLDSSYGSLEYFVDWVKGDASRRLVSLFTDHLAKTNDIFMDDLAKAHVTFQKLDEATASDAEFEHRGVTFMHTKGPHDQVPVDYFGRLLKTRRWRRNSWFGELVSRGQSHSPGAVMLAVAAI